MDTFLITSGIVLPLFLVIACGVVLRHLKLVSSDTCHQMNRLVFRFFLPAYLIQSIMNTDLDAVKRPGIFVFIAVSYVLMFSLLFIIVPCFEKNKTFRGVMIQGAGRSNYALFGIPLAASIYPGGDLSLLSLLIIVVIPVSNTLSIFALETNRGGKLSPSVFLKSFFLSPLTIAVFVGFIGLLLKPPIPAFLKVALNDIAKIASPLALVMLGASIDFRRALKHLKQIAFVVLVKNLIAPAICLSAAYFFGFRNIELVAVLICFAAPSAVNSFAMATQMGGDPDLAAECVVFTSAFSAVSVFAFVYMLLNIGAI